MQKTMAGLVGAVAALGTLEATAAAPMTANPVPSMQVGSFAQLLEPIPNAAEMLRILDRQAPADAEEGDVVRVGYYHHHHHHHHWRRRRYHHHHHHHHHYY